MQKSKQGPALKFKILHHSNRDCCCAAAGLEHVDVKRNAHDIGTQYKMLEAFFVEGSLANQN